MIQEQPSEEVVEDEVAQLAAAVRTAWQEFGAIKKQLVAAQRRRNQLPVDLATVTDAKAREKLRAERIELDEALEVGPLHQRAAADRLAEAFVAYAGAVQRVEVERYQRVQVGRRAFAEYYKGVQAHKARLDHLETRMSLERTRATSLRGRVSGATAETIESVLENYFPFRPIPEEEIAELLRIPGLEGVEGNGDGS